MQSGADIALPWYRRRSLRAELATGFGAVIVLTLVVGSVALFAQSRSTDAIDRLVTVVNRIAELSMRSTVAMLKARRAEKDFLIFRNEFGFQEARSRYTTLFRTGLAEVRQSMADLRELSSEPELHRSTRSIEQAVNRYETGFLEVVELYGSRGHVTTGLEGRIREKAHGIETLVAAARSDLLMIDLLTLRRHEKDYIARGIDKYADAFAVRLDVFRADVAAARLSPEVKATLLGLAADYGESFQQYVRADSRIDEARAAYLVAAHTIEPLLEKLHASAELDEYVTGSRAEREAQIATWTIGGAVLLASLLGLAIALVITRSITKSVDECLGFAGRVAQGDLSTRLAPQGQTEFGTLAVALNRMTEALEERESGLKRAQSMAGLASLISAPDGTFERWSETLPGLLGIGEEEMPRDIRQWHELIHPMDRGVTRAKSLQAAASRGRFEGEYRLRRGDAGWTHLRQVAEPLGALDAAGKGRWFSTLQDITEQKRAEAGVQRLNRVYAVSSGINALIVRVRDRDELFREACRIAVEDGHFAKAWLGIVDRSPKGFRMAAAFGGEPLFFSQLEMKLREIVLAGRGIVARAVATLKPTVSNYMASDPEVVLKEDAVDGGVQSLAVLPLIVAGEAVGVLTLNADTPGFFDAEEMNLLAELAGNIAFAIEHIDKRERLDYLSKHDELTGLANRGAFLERVAQHMRSSASGGYQLAVGLIDLERFRNINASLDRSAGDDLLRQVAQWLTTGAGDASLVARVGADQFAVVMPEVRTGGNIARLLEKMVKAFMDHPFRLKGAEFRIAAKGGVALFPGDGDDAGTLLRHAEAALKKAKASGERYLFYTPTMTATVAGNLTLENQLRQALEKEEFVLHYQPKINLQTGKLTGAEALIRWNDPRSGLVPPGRFIPILEETGLILEVGRWALRRAIKDYLDWRSTGLLVVRIAVNVSPLQLRNREFVAEIEAVIGIDVHAAAGLELEITESVIMQDINHNIATLQAIRSMGVTTAIDDFGTGFSSLSYLAKLPVDTLKIDRSFVIDMTEGPQGLALVSTVINLARSLNLKVVAEGVETAEQSNLLRLLGCDEMQGYLFSKPVPGEVFETSFLAVPAVA